MTDLEPGTQSELPNGFTAMSCVVVECRTCEEPYQNDEMSGVIHFDDVADATNFITEDGWTVSDDGAQCGACACKVKCAEQGHRWLDWRPCKCEGHIVDHTVQMEWRPCDVCEETEERVTEAIENA